MSILYSVSLSLSSPAEEPGRAAVGVDMYVITVVAVWIVQVVSGGKESTPQVYSVPVCSSSEGR